MTLQSQCDVCGKVGDNSAINEYYHQDLCQKCLLNTKLAEMKQQYEHDRSWLENTHLKALQKLNNEIMKLEEEIKEKKL